MWTPVLKSKIHRATVTDANLEYEGSITIDTDLLRAAGIEPFEFVHVWNVTNGSRFDTYTIAGEAGSGTVCINGAAAHLTHSGDVVIIASRVLVTPEEQRSHTPRLVFVNGENRIVRVEIVNPQQLAPQ